MKILSMTATFGKLENAVLQPQQGLSIIEAPNEWGKSTWCAFLAAMFYGIDTRFHSTKTALSPKERYQPWSGSPMAGRIDLIHEGRAITIERSTKGRIPMGQFRAYETESGLDVPELTAENCGQVLLGVEREVFLRCALVRQGDLPVTQNDALRRRLNALVTTGDESGAAGVLMEKLSKLKNTIRSNSRNGLLPQAQMRRQELEEKLEEMEILRQQIEMLQQQLALEDEKRKTLMNHQQALQYQKYLAAKASQAQVRAEEQALQEQIRLLEAACAGMPGKEGLLALREEVLGLQQQKNALYRELSGIREIPDPPEELFGERDPDRLERKIQLDQKAREDCLRQLGQKQQKLWPFGLGLVLLGLGLCFLSWVAGLVAGVLGVGVLILSSIKAKGRKERDLKLNLVLADIRSTYGSDDPGVWWRMAEDYRRQVSQYEQALQREKASRSRHTEQIGEVNRHLRNLTEGMEPETFIRKLDEALDIYNRLEQNRRELIRVCAHAAALGELPVAEPPAGQDDLSFTAEETEKLLRESELRSRSIESRIRTLEGRMEALGDPRGLQQEIKTLAERICKLTQTLDAIELARKTLEESIQELQRRFAPGLTRRASERFGELTEGRYGRLRLDRELTMLCAAEGEEVLRSVLWRSDGTADQLYLALRLALWEELAPNCPLILDDVMVRFDDKRLLQALKVLRALGEERQILLFTCQSREQTMIKTL